MNELEDKGPVFKAKELKAEDVIEHCTGGGIQTYRVVANSSDGEVLLQRWNCSYNESAVMKRVSHESLDTAKFIHVGKVPSFVKRFFTNIDKF